MIQSSQYDNKYGMSFPRMPPAGILFLVVPVCHLGAIAETESGSVCIAPESGKLKPFDPMNGVFCESGRLSLSIDKQPSISWPTKESTKIGDLSLEARHRVVVLCDGKPQQTFTFRFSDKKGTELCLFLDGAYRTVQLWDRKGSPWCKCKSASAK